MWQWETQFKRVAQSTIYSWMARGIHYIAHTLSPEPPVTTQVACRVRPATIYEWRMLATTIYSSCGRLCVLYIGCANKAIKVYYNYNIFAYRTSLNRRGSSNKHILGTLCLCFKTNKKKKISSDVRVTVRQLAVWHYNWQHAAVVHHARFFDSLCTCVIM